MNYIHTIEIKGGLDKHNIQEVQILLHGKVIKRIYILTNSHDIVMTAQETFEAFNGLQENIGYVSND